MTPAAASQRRAEPRRSVVPQTGVDRSVPGHGWCPGPDRGHHYHVLGHLGPDARSLGTVRGASGRETGQEAAEPLRVLEQERVAGVREDGRDPVGDAISHRNGLLHVLHDVLRTVGDEKGNSNVTEPFPAGVFSAIPPADGGVLVDPGLLLDQLGYAVSAVVATAEYRTAGGSARLGVGEEQEEDVLDRGVFLAADLDGPGALRWPYARLAGAAAGDGDGREQFGVVCGEKLSDEAAHRPADQVDLVKALGPDEVHDSV